MVFINIFIIVQVYKNKIEKLIKIASAKDLCGF